MCGTAVNEWLEVGWVPKGEVGGQVMEGVDVEVAGYMKVKCGLWRSERTTFSSPQHPWPAQPGSTRLAPMCPRDASAPVIDDGVAGERPNTKRSTKPSGSMDPP